MAASVAPGLLSANFRAKFLKVMALLLSDEAARVPTNAVPVIVVTGTPSGAYGSVYPVMVAVQEDAAVADEIFWVTVDTGTTWVTLDAALASDWELPSATELTIATGAITCTQAFHTVDTEADAASDDLDTINGVAAGELVYLVPNNTGRTVVFKHGTGNITCPAGRDVSLDDSTDYVIVIGTAAGVVVFEQQQFWEDLASATNGLGASMVGLEDAAGNLAATDVEAGIAEIFTLLASVATGEGSALIGAEDAGGFYTATTVEGMLQNIAQTVVTGLSVDSATTGIAATDSDTASISVGGSTDADGTQAVTGTSSNAGTGATGSSTATVTEDEAEPAWMQWVNPAAAGANVLAQKNANFDEAVWANLTQPDVFRNLQIVANGAWAGGDITVEGIDMTGDDVTKAYTPVQGATTEYDDGWMRIRRVAGNISAGTIDVQCGPKLAAQVGAKTPTLLEAYEDSAGGRDAGAAMTAAGLIAFSAAPNAARDYFASYSLAGGYTDAGHTHTGPSHGHGAGTYAGPSHTHGSTALTATDAGHTHGLTDGGHVHTTTDGGHTHAS